jgi:preprotein translocase subunit YajC
MPEASAAPTTNPVAMFFPFIVIMLIFYFIVFRPQMKAKKDHERMLGQLKKNDEVVTSGGLYGTVVNVKPDAITLRIAENVRVDVERTAIIRLVKDRAQSNGDTAPAERRA